jgi:hypothetical protein
MKIKQIVVVALLFFAGINCFADIEADARDDFIKNIAQRGVSDWNNLADRDKQAYIKVYQNKLVQQQYEATLSQYGETYSRPVMLILPFTGGEAGELAASFLARQHLIAGYFDVIDLSGKGDDAALAAKIGSRNAAGMAVDYDALLRLANEYHAHLVISGGVTQLGKKTALIATYDVYNKEQVGAVYLDYADPVELWVKLPQAAESLARVQDQYKYKDKAAFLTLYRQGVNREEAAMLVDYLVAMVSIIVKDSGGAAWRGSTGIFPLNMTATVDRKIAERNGKVSTLVVTDDNTGDYIKVPESNWIALFERRWQSVKNWKRGGPDANYDIFHDLAADAKAVFLNGAGYYFVEVSKPGRNTRMEIFTNGENIITVDYASPADFMRQLSGAASRTAGLFPSFEGTHSDWVYTMDLSKIKTAVPMPDTFDRIKRQGQGGLYVSGTSVSQREFQAVLGRNSDVHKMTIRDAMEYCNVLSVRDGLVPAYDVVYKQANNLDVEHKYAKSADDKLIKGIIWNREANGYRLLTKAEWQAAAKDRDAKSEVWTYDGNEDYTNIRGVDVFDKPLFLARPVFDYWHYQVNSSIAAPKVPVHPSPFIPQYFRLTPKVPELDTSGPYANVQRYIDAGITAGSTALYWSYESDTDYRLYYSTEKDFATAKLYGDGVLPIPLRGRWTDRSNSDVHTQWTWVKGLTPGGTYYFWLSAQPGGLGWLEGKPTEPIEVIVK